MQRTEDGSAAVVGIVSGSWQGGCLSVSESRTDAVMTRLDDLRAWVLDVTKEPPVGEVTGDDRADIVAFYKYADDAAVSGSDENVALWVFGGVADSQDPVRVFRVSQSVMDWDRTVPVLGDFDDDGLSEFVGITRS